MPRKPKQFILVDPRDLDGNPYEVAIRSIEQASALADMYRVALSDARIMARNAGMERQIALGGPASAADWEAGPEAGIITRLQADTVSAPKMLRTLAMAAGYDPKNPPK